MAIHSLARPFLGPTIRFEVIWWLSSLRPEYHLATPRLMPNRGADNHP